MEWFWNLPQLNICQFVVLMCWFVCAHLTDRLHYNLHRHETAVPNSLKSS